MTIVGRWGGCLTSLARSAQSSDLLLEICRAHQQSIPMGQRFSDCQLSGIGFPIGPCVGCDCLICVQQFIPKVHSGIGKHTLSRIEVKNPLRTDEQQNIGVRNGRVSGTQTMTHLNCGQEWIVHGPKAGQVLPPNAHTCRRKYETVSIKFNQDGRA